MSVPVVDPLEIPEIGDSNASRPVIRLRTTGFLLEPPHDVPAVPHSGQRVGHGLLPPSLDEIVQRQKRAHVLRRDLEQIGISPREAAFVHGAEDSVQRIAELQRNGHFIDDSRRIALASRKTQERSPFGEFAAVRDSGLPFVARVLRLRRFGTQRASVRRGLVIPHPGKPEIVGENLRHAGAQRAAVALARDLPGEAVEEAELPRPLVQFASGLHLLHMQRDV